MCYDQEPVTLSEAGETLSGTQLPEWVSQGGKAIFQNAVNLIKPQFEIDPATGEPKLDAAGNPILIPQFQYDKPTQASYFDMQYDYDGDNMITQADADAASAAGNQFHSSAISDHLSGTAPLPMSKLSAEEQMAGKMLTEGAEDYKGYLEGVDTDGDGIPDTQSAKTFMDQIGQGYLGTKEDGTPRTYQDLYGDMYGDDFKIGEGTEAQKYIDIYSAAMDPAIKDIQEQTALQQQEARDAAAKVGAFGGSRLGLREATLGAEGIESAADLRAKGLAEGLGFAAGRFDLDRQARFDADAAARGAYETEEAARLAAAKQYEDMATLSQGLQQQAAAGLITSGEAKRLLDQKALDTAYAQFLDAKREPFENINFALGTLQGVPYNQQSYGYNLATGQEQGPSVYGQTLGALGTLGSAYYMGAG